MRGIPHATRAKSIREERKNGEGRQARHEIRTKREESKEGRREKREEGGKKREESEERDERRLGVAKKREEKRGEEIKTEKGVDRGNER